MKRLIQDPFSSVSPKTAANNSFSPKSVVPVAIASPKSPLVSSPKVASSNQSEPLQQCNQCGKFGERLLACAQCYLVF